MTNSKSSVIIFCSGPAVMIKCTPLPLCYSRHKLAYENEAVFLTYSYITTNSQTTENKAMILA